MKQGAVEFKRRKITAQPREQYGRTDRSQRNPQRKVVDRRWGRSRGQS